FIMDYSKIKINVNGVGYNYSGQYYHMTVSSTSRNEFQTGFGVITPPGYYDRGGVFWHIYINSTNRDGWAAGFGVITLANCYESDFYKLLTYLNDNARNNKNLQNEIDTLKKKNDELQNKIKEQEGIYQELKNVEKQAEECLNIIQKTFEEKLDNLVETTFKRSEKTRKFDSKKTDTIVYKLHRCLYHLDEVNYDNYENKNENERLDRLVNECKKLNN
ncbi:12270_t:CDS:2, partial [Cetraspora pellucida]